MFYSLVAGVVGTLVSVAAGYGLSKFRTPGGVVVQGMVLAGLLFPVALMTVPLYLRFHSMGLVNTPWAVIIPSCVSPFGVFLGRIYVEASVPTNCSRPPGSTGRPSCGCSSRSCCACWRRRW